MKDFTQARINMVKNQVMTNNVFDHRILEAMGEVPRHQFLEEKWQNVAYVDTRLPVGEGRMMLDAPTFARMLEACELNSKDRVLDIGCGTGYSTVIISKIVASVVGLESNQSLAIRAADYVQKAFLKNIAIKTGDVLYGAPENAPYDLILVNGALRKTPEELLIQLKNEGRLVVIEPYHGVMKVVKYINLNGHYAKTELFDAYAEFI